MKLPSLFKIQEKSSFSSLLCPSRRCGSLKTLSFRVENNQNIFNSQRFDNNDDEDIVGSVIEDIKKEKDRLIFEGGEKTSSILEVLSSKNNGGSKGFEFPPFNDSCVVTMMDPFEDSKKPMGEIVEANQDIKTSSILDVASSSKSNDDSGKGFELLPFNNSYVMTLVDSMDPHGDSKESMVEANQENDSCVTTMDSMDPYGESKKSMKEMAEVNQEIKTSSILEVASSSKWNNNSSSNEFEFQPLNDTCVVTTMEEMVEESQETKTSSILEEGSSSKSKNDSTNGLEFLPFNDSSVVTEMDSMNPYEDFKKSIEEMLEANQDSKDCEGCLEELLIWYLKSNGENNHKYIIDAFFDLLNSHSSTNATSYSHSLTNSPFSFCSSSFSASPLSLLEGENEITIPRFSV